MRIVYLLIGVGLFAVFNHFILGSVSNVGGLLGHARPHGPMRPVAPPAFLRRARSPEPERKSQPAGEIRAVYPDGHVLTISPDR